MAGRLTLLSSVISGIIGYWTSAFFLPKKVIKAISSMCSSFLWYGTIDLPRGAKVAWAEVSTQNQKEGWGLGMWKYEVIHVV